MGGFCSLCCGGWRVSSDGLDGTRPCKFSAEAMQDDVYLIASGDGWREAAKPRQMVEDKDKKSKDKPDFVLGRQKFKAELIPTKLLIARYFGAEQTAIETLESEAAAAAQAMEELAEEHGGEDTKSPRSRAAWRNTSKRWGSTHEQGRQTSNPQQHGRVPHLHPAGGRGRH